MFDIDTSNFPIMKAKFWAFDAAGKQQYPLPSEIKVLEDGNQRKVTSISCPPVSPSKRLSVILSIDISSSMMGISGSEDYFSIAKAGATYVVDNLPLGLNECAVSSFNNVCFINQDYSINKARLQKAISQLILENGTDYDKALFLPVAGALEITAHAKYAPVIVFISDGYCNTLQQLTIIAKAKAQSCKVFSIIVGPNCPQSLKDIATQTGGKWFENVNSSSQIKEICASIAGQAQGTDPCEISWESSESCSGLTNINFQWNNQEFKNEYQKPTRGIISIAISASSIYVHSKPPGIKFDTTIVIAAINSDILITQITSSNPLYDINPKTFTLKNGQSQVLTISYTPVDSNYSWCLIDIESDKCNKQFNVSGLYIGRRFTRQSLKLVQPNGGEELVAGSDTLIKWTGIPTSDLIKLEFSSDQGVSWVNITNNATDGEYLYKVPKVASDKCLAKATHKISDGVLSWVEQARSGNFTRPRRATSDILGNVYMTGWFGGNVAFGTDTIKSVGPSDDAYIVKYLPDGNVGWAKSGGGIRSSPWGEAVLADKLGNVYLIANMSNGESFDGISITCKDGDIAIIKILQDGKLEWLKFVGGQGNDYCHDGVIDDSGYIFLTGVFSDSIGFGGNSISGGGVFTAKLAPDGNIVWARKNGGEVIDADNNGNVWVAGGGGVVKYNSDNTIGWSKSTGLYHEAIVVDNWGNAYVCGNGGFVTRYKPDGNVAWTTYAGSRCYDIAIDLDGKIVVSGHYKGKCIFGTDTLTNNGTEDIFVAGLTSEGKIEWVATAGGPNDFDHGKAIAIDPSNNIYVVGIFTGTAIFPLDTLAALGTLEQFVWKIPGLSDLQSDTSDAVFSIVMPSPLVKDIDMGNVLVGEMRDSLIPAFVTNGGSYEFSVDSIAVLNNSEFALQSNNTPFIVSAKGSQMAEFRFQPSSPGPKSAQIMVVTQADTLYQTITGNGVQPVISTIGSVIDFGTLEVMDLKDTTIKIAITNNGTLPIDFTGDAQLGPDKTQFSLLSGGGTFTLQPNESREVSIRFAPRFIGRTSGRIGFNFNGPGSPAVLQLFGQGLGGRVKVADDSAFAGQKRNVGMTLLGSPSTSLQSIATGFKARVAYNSTVLAPFGGNVVRGDGVDTVTVEGSLGNDNMLTSVPFLAGLGNAELSSMDLVEFMWLDALGNPADYDVETESGTFKLLGLCEDGGKRLFDPNGQVSITSITPNPASESMQVKIETLEKGRTQVVLMDVLGREIARLYDGEIGSGAHTLSLNTSGVAAGSYYLSLSTPTVKKFVRVDIAR